MMDSDIDISNVPSSIEEFFTAEEFAKIVNYERLHLSNLRQNYEVLQRFGLSINPPEFMLRRRAKLGKRRCIPPSKEESEGSESEWTPDLEKVKAAVGGSKRRFEPQFSSKQKRKSCSRDNSNQRPKRKLTREKTKTAVQEQERRHGYPLRRQRIVKYMSLAIPDDDDFLYCEDCNMEHLGDCPFHGSLVVVPDKQVDESLKGKDADYCKLTLPTGLMISTSKIPNAGLGVFATQDFPARILFGPYKGTKEYNEEIAHDSGYSWQVYKDGKPSHFVDARHPLHSNWMRFINCARSEDEQCLTAYQYQGEIYYRARKEIPKGRELLVYYGDDYAKDLGIAVQQNGMLPKCRDQANTNSNFLMLYDASSDSYPCRMCKLAFTSGLLMEYHLKRKHNDEYWKIIRNKRDKSGKQADVNLHAITQGHACSEGQRDKLNRNKSLDDEKSFKYTECDKCFSQSGHLNSHMRTHSGEKPFRYTKCDICFSESGHLNSHMRTHTGEKPFKCTECGKCFSRSDVLNSHMRTHTGEKPFKCTECGKCFNRNDHLNSHMRTHTGEKPFKCTECGKCFSRSDVLNSHMRTHTGEKPLKCTECGKCFNRNDHLNSHMRTHTGEKPFKCTECGKCFSWSGDLNRHMKSHTGEKPFKCTECGKCFSLSGDLNSHMKTHTGEKPFKCTECGKCFSWSGDLNSHMRIHTGEKPFKCTECGKCFSRSDVLNSHMKTHTGEKPFK